MGVFLSDIPNQLQETLNGIIGDNTDGVEGKAVYSRYFNVESMDGDAYVDELEFAAEGLVSEKGEGRPMQLKGAKEGMFIRYIARAFAREMQISREAMDDAKYPEAIKLSKHNKRQMWKTVDYDAANVLIRAENTNYVGGDGLPLASASHTLAWGGTYSNKMATPMSPSHSALVTAISQLKMMPGHDGNIEGFEAVKLLHPSVQWAVWQGILGSEKRAEDGNFAEINVLKPIGLEQVEIKYWNTVTTEWGLTTDAEDGLKWFWHTRPEPTSWMDNRVQVMSHGIYARWARGWTNPRGYFHNGA
jgi:hypothetical protein